MKPEERAAPRPASRHRFSRQVWGLAVVLAAMLLISMQGAASAKLVIFSAVSGQVLVAGKPAVGAVVEREFRWAWKQENGTDRAETGSNGGFELPAIDRRSLLGSLLPHEPGVRQTIRILHAGKSHPAWLFDKRNYRAEGEIGKAIVMTCRLESEAKPTGDVYGICDLQ